ncbi:hypothetical protein B0H14DRAFT_2779732 [Mycena olivaceomarginata]|nr:hypothetical protein B0H14DRAFT_2779732 [Mycena olivaceomarginata]
MTYSADGLNFIIVGASVSGLASAISLKKSGHNVLVLEKDSQLGGADSVCLNRRPGCHVSLICPNGSKILLDWGLLDAEVKAKSADMPGFAFFKYHAGERPDPDFLGENRWNEEMLFEARGGYMQLFHQDLLRLLYDEATKKGESSSRVSVVFGAEIESVDCDACTVTLQSGETHTGDVIIGADGARGVVRQTLMQEEDASLEDDVLTGTAVYSTIIPKASIVENGLEKWFYEYDDIGSSIWVGSNRSAWIFPVGEANDLVLWVYTPDSTQDGSWTDKAEIKLTDVLGPCDVRLERLAALAKGPAACVQIRDPYPLESWVSESGKVMVLGDAAHPFPPGGFHRYSVALEDAAFIGKIFSHTRDRKPQHRESRCVRIREIEMEYVTAANLPEGEAHNQRDIGMRENHAAGRNALEGNFEQMLEDYRIVFGYDAMDDAEEWWINWGRFRERAMSNASGGVNFAQSISNTTSSGSGDEEELEEKY